MEKNEIANISVKSPIMEWLAHSVDRSVSVIILGLAAAAVIFVGYGIYKAFIKKPPASTTIGSAEMVDQRQFRQTFGCMRIEPLKTGR